MPRSYAVIAALLVFSFGFSSAFADDSLVNPDNLIFNNIPESVFHSPAPTITDPLTGEAIQLDSSEKYTAYPAEMGSQINSDDKQLVEVNGQEFYLVPDTLDKTANIVAVLLLAIPFGLLVYRMSDNDPIPLKYAKLSG
ncbi:MAG: hypothetical protein P8X83_09055, partial [Nitrosopumilaceae archaeon]